MSKNKIAGQLIYFLFCAFSGAVIASIIWAFLKLMSLGIDFVWQWVPSQVNIPFYTIGVCVLGGLILGVYQHKFGQYPEDLDTVAAKVKKDKSYPYDNVFVICLAALIPLVFGGSLGPEAGLTGVIVGLCYWAGNHMKYAKNKISDLMEIGFSATLGVIFGAPLFGLVAPIEEKTDAEKDFVLPKGPKIISIIIAVLSSVGMYWLMTSLFGGGLGLPRIEAAAITNYERFWGIPVALMGVAFGYIYLIFEKLTKSFFTRFQSKFNIIFSTVLGGLLLGVLGTVLPLTMFSGESQIEQLSETYLTYAPWMLILIGTVKLLLTNICIKSGWRGGHFFPVIFCGISIGYGVAMLTGVNPAFCLGVVTAGLLGVIMRKPIAVSLLLMLCFPVRVIPWLIIAAILGSIVPLGKLSSKPKLGRKKNEKQ